jgi:hypothetical protein
MRVEPVIGESPIVARDVRSEARLKLSVTVFPELAELLERERPAEVAGRSDSFPVAGAGFEPATSGL